MAAALQVLYFAGIAELLGRREETIHAFDGVCTVADLARLLVTHHPELAGRLETVRFAVNETFVDRDASLSPGDTVALIPPVSGG